MRAVTTASLVAMFGLSLTGAVGCGGAITGATTDDAGGDASASDAPVSVDAPDDDSTEPPADAGSEDAPSDAYSDALYEKHPWDAESLVCPPGSHLPCNDTAYDCNAWTCICDNGTETDNYRTCALGSCVPGIQACMKQCGSMDNIWWFELTGLGADGGETCVTCDAPGCAPPGAACSRDGQCCSCACGSGGCQ